MIWLSFIVPIWVDHHSFHFLIALFCIPSPLSKSFFHLLSISYILTHFWFDTFYTSFTCFIDSLNNYHFSCSVVDISLGYLGSMAHELFYTCCILYTRAWVFYYWLFEPSFPSFLLLYHPSLHYVLCLKTTLRPWDQMSFLIALTWTGVWDLVDI